jgi:putative hemolysin
MFEIALIALLILGNGVFAMAEMAVVSANRIRLQRRADGGDNGAARAAVLVDAPNDLLATVQVGITLIGVLSGAFGGAALAEPLAAALGRVAWLAPYAYPVAMGLVVVAITYASLVIGELVPKRLALNAPEAIAARLAAPMAVVSRIAAPLVRLLGASSEVLLRLLRVREVDEEPVDEQDISMLVEEGLKQGTVEPAEREIIVNAFWLGERRVNAILTPRLNVAWLDLSEGLAGLRRALDERPHSRYLVCRGSVDDVVGYVMTRDLVGELLDGHAVDLRKHVKQPLFVPETQPTLTLLEQFKATGVHFAVVLDEYGGVEGVVTLRDLVEELVGEVPDEEDAHSPAVIELAPQSWSVRGSLELDDLEKLIGVSGGATSSLAGSAGADPAEVAPTVSVRTVGGLVALRTGQVPRVGDAIVVDGWRLVVTDTDRLRVTRVKVSKVAGRSKRTSPAPQVAGRTLRKDR